MKKYFSLRFCLDTLHRQRVFALVALILVVAGSLMSNIAFLLDYFLSFGQATDTSMLTRLSLLDLNSSLGTLVYILAPLMTVTSFSFLTKRSEADFYEALPIRRGAMIISGALAVLGIVAAIIAVSSLSEILIISPCIGKTVDYSFLEGLYSSFGVLLAAILAVAGTMVAVSLTGTVKSAVVTAASILFVPRMVLALVNNSVMGLAPVLVKGHVIPLFDNNYNILTALLLGNKGVLNNPFAYLYTALLAAIYSILAYILFLRRKSETATHPFVCPIARHVTSVLGAVYLAMLGVYLISVDQLLIAVAVILFVLSLLFYFAYEMISGRREKSFGSTVKAFPVMLCTVGILVAAVFISSSILGSYSPEADEIDSVSLSTDLGEETYGYISYSQYVTLRSENVRLTDGESKKIVSEALKRGYDDNLRGDYISIVLKIDSGLDHYRRVSLTAEEYERLLSILSENEDYKALWMKVSEGAVSPMIHGTADVFGEGALRVLRTMEKEIGEIGFEKWCLLNSGYGESAANVQYTVKHSNVYYTVTVDVFVEMPKTYAVYLEELDKATAVAYDSLKRSLTEAAEGEGESLKLSVSAYGIEYDGYYVDVLISDDDYSRALVRELFELCEAKKPDAENGFALSLYTYSDDLSSDGEYAEFNVPKERLGALESFFEKHGEE